MLAATTAVCPTRAIAYRELGATWPTSDLPVRYRIDVASAPESIGAEGARTAVVQGFAPWSTAPCGTRWRTLHAGATTRPQARTPDGDNSVVWLTSDWPPELGDAGTTVAATTHVVTDGHIMEADIQFNAAGFRWTLTGAEGTIDTQTVATHEGGHLLGLEHSDVRTAVMYGGYTGVRRTLDPDDASGVCALYPSDGDAGAPDDRDADAAVDAGQGATDAAIMGPDEGFTDAAAGPVSHAGCGCRAGHQGPDTPAGTLPGLLLTLTAHRRRSRRRHST